MKQSYLSILCHKWQTGFILLRDIGSYLSILFEFLVVFFIQNGKSLFLPSLICLLEWPYCPTNRVVENGFGASGALLFKEEPEAYHFLQK